MRVLNTNSSDADVNTDATCKRVSMSYNGIGPALVER